MELFGTGLMYVGAGVMFFGFLWSLVFIFQDNALLGVVCLFVPLVLLVALSRRWPQSRGPLLAWLGGLALFLIGAVLSHPSK